MMFCIKQELGWCSVPPVLGNSSTTENWQKNGPNFCYAKNTARQLSLSIECGTRQLCQVSFVIVVSTIGSLFEQNKQFYLNRDCFHLMLKAITVTNCDLSVLACFGVDCYSPIAEEESSVGRWSTVGNTARNRCSYGSGLSVCVPVDTVSSPSVDTSVNSYRPII